MIENELGSFNFAFDMKNVEDRDDFIEIGMTQLGLQARLLVKDEGKYSFKLTISEMLTPEAKSQEAQIEQSECYKQAIGQ